MALVAATVPRFPLSRFTPRERHGSFYVMSQSDSPISETSRAILDEIKRVFGEVQRGNGVTLHETEVIDDHGSEEEREEARRKDTDRHWWEVRDEWIEGCVGLSFLDEAGFHYYLPAYMSYRIRTGKEPWGLDFHLQHDQWDFERIFSLAKKKMIAKFLDYVKYQFEDVGSGETLDEFWRGYFDAPIKTQ